MVVIIPATINGTPKPNPSVNEAVAGPNTNPKFSAEPISPNAFARSSGFVESEMTANATGILPAVNPSNALAKKRKKAFGAKAVIKNDIAVPRIDMINNGLRPYLSDNLPMIGVEIN